MAFVGYCDVCGTRIPKDHFESGKAIEVAGKAFCADHLDAAPQPEVRKGPSSAPSRRLTNRVSTSRRASRVATSRRTPSSVRPATGVRDAVSARPGSTRNMVLTATFVVVVGGGVIAAVLGGAFGPAAGGSTDSTPDGGVANETRDLPAPVTDPAIDQWNRQLAGLQSELLRFRSESRDLDAQVQLALERWRGMMDEVTGAPDEIRLEADKLRRAWGFEAAALLVQKLEAELDDLAGSCQAPAAASLAHRVLDGLEPERVPPGLVTSGAPAIERLRERTDTLDAMAAKWRDTDVAMEAAERLRLSGRHAEARRAFDAILEQFPDRYDALTYRAFCIRRLGDVRTAKADLDRVVQMAPRWPNGWFQRAYACAELNDFAGAIENYDRVLEIRPETPQALQNRGVCHTRVGNFDKARDDLRKATDLTRTDPDAPYLLATLHRDQGEIEDAIRYYTEALRRKPDLHRARYQRAVMYRTIRQYDEAERELTECSRVMPREWNVWYQLALTVTEKPGGDPAAALEYLHKAREVVPNAQAREMVDALTRRLGG